MSVLYQPLINKGDNMDYSLEIDDIKDDVRMKVIKGMKNLLGKEEFNLVLDCVDGIYENEFDVEIMGTIVPYVAAQGPSYSSGGQPAEGGYIDDLDVMLVYGKESLNLTEYIDDKTLEDIEIKYYNYLKGE